MSKTTLILLASVIMLLCISAEPKQTPLIKGYTYQNIDDMDVARKEYNRAKQTNERKKEQAASTAAERNFALVKND